LRGVHEAHLPVDLVDEEVPDEAYVLVVGVEDLAVDQVAGHEEDVRVLFPALSMRSLLLSPYSLRGRPMEVKYQMKGATDGRT
jgi:hypothetical protein